MRTYRLAVTAILSAGALVLGACQSTDDPAGEAEAAAGDCAPPSEPMTIEALASTSGPLAAVGEAMSAGMRAAVTTINDNGGVLGSPVSLNITDNAGTADKSAAILQDLISRGTPDAVIPGSGSETAAGIPLLASAGVFTAHHFPGPEFDDTEKYPLAFGSAYNTDHHVVPLAAELAAAGYQKIGHIHQDDAGGDAYREAVEKHYGELGLENEFVGVANEAIDATPQLQRLMASDPDALVFTAFGPLAGVMAQARDKLEIDLPTYGTPPFAANPLEALAPEEVFDDIVLQSPATSVLGTDAQQTEAFDIFYAALEAELDGNIPLGINTYLVAYNDVVLAASAANLAGCIDAEAMADAVRQAGPSDMPYYVAPVDFSDSQFANFSAEWFVLHNFGPLEGGLIVPKS